MTLSPAMLSTSANRTLSSHRDKRTAQAACTGHSLHWYRGSSMAGLRARGKPQ
jgi:hypothetical protein